VWPASIQNFERQDDARLHKREPDFGSLAVSALEPVALFAPALPVPTASTEQKHNHDDNQDRF
jgi:hypothetical protein